MKKLLGIAVLGLLWCNVAFSKNYHDQIFGIKIFDDVSNYIVCSTNKIILPKNEDCILFLKKGLKEEFELAPEETKYINTSLPYTSKEVMKLMVEEYKKSYNNQSKQDENNKQVESLENEITLKYKWKKNPLFEDYNLIVDKDFRTVSITGGIKVFDHNINEFQNKCRAKKEDLVKRISNIHNIPKNKFVEYDYKNTYPKADPKKNGGVSVESSYLKYFVKDEPVILRVLCNYRIHKNSTKVKSYLVYQLSTLNYWSDRIEKANRSGRIKREIKNLTDEDIVRNDTGL